MTRRLGDIFRNGLREIPFTTAPPQWSSAFDAALVLPLPKRDEDDDPFARIFDQARFRVKCARESSSIRVSARGNSSYDEKYRISSSTTWPALVAVADHVSDKNVTEWEKTNGKLKSTTPTALYLITTDGGDVPIVSH